MKRILSFLLIAFVLTGAGCGEKEKAVIMIDDIEVTKSEFNSAFAASRFAYLGEEGKEKFLDSLISTKLMLKKAEEMGVDKDPQFLKEIQFFWEKALVKLVLAKKLDVLGEESKVSDADIRRYYKRNRKTRFVDKELPEVYEKIKWFLTQDRQSKAMVGWVGFLRSKAEINIDYEALGVKK